MIKTTNLTKEYELNFTDIAITEEKVQDTITSLYGSPFEEIYSVELMTYGGNMPIDIMIVRKHPEHGTAGFSLPFIFYLCRNEKIIFDEFEDVLQFIKTADNDYNSPYVKEIIKCLVDNPHDETKEVTLWLKLQ